MDLGTTDIIAPQLALDEGFVYVRYAVPNGRIPVTTDVRYSVVDDLETLTIEAFSTMVDDPHYSLPPNRRVEQIDFDPVTFLLY